MEPLIGQLPKPDPNIFKLKVCSAASLLCMIGLIYIQINVNGLYGNGEYDYEEFFNDWKQSYNKVYQSRDEEHRGYLNFKSNYDRIEEWNSDSDKTSKVALNKFADLNSEEFKAICCSYQEDDESLFERKAVNQKKVNKALNWTAFYDVSESDVMYHDSYAASIVGSIEGLYHKHNGKKVSFSIDQLTTCANLENDQQSGNFSHIYEYILHNGVVTTQSSSRPTPNDGNTCEDNPEEEIFDIKNYKFLPRNNYEEVLKATNKYPIVAAIQADVFALQFYSEGVISYEDCDENVNQGVLITGYGVHPDIGLEYWIVKNYWGSDWGMNGFVLIERGEINTCGILSYASLPIM